MRRVICSMSVSLDGYISGPDGGLDWGAPDDELLRFIVDQQYDVGAQLMGRRLYETMLYWETAEQDHRLGETELEWARLWKALPKVVFSTTLATVRGGNTRLATAGLPQEIARLRAGATDGDIAVGGAMLAAEAAALDLIDEYRVRVCPVLLGSGVPLFGADERRVDLELVESRSFGSGVAYLRYRTSS